MTRKVCAICGCSLPTQNERICGNCENILTSDKRDEVFKIMYPKINCNLQCIKAGDYVNYIPDGKNVIKELETNEIRWRVWAIDGDEVVIMPTEPVGRVKMGAYHDFNEAFKDYKKAVPKIEAECAKYGSKKAKRIRSLAIDDLENPNVSALAKRKMECYNGWYKYGELTRLYTSGEFWPVEYDRSNEKNKILYSYRSATRNQPVRLQQTDYYTMKPEWKSLGKSDETYGTLLGAGVGWLASLCVDCDLYLERFGVRIVAYCGEVFAKYLLYSNGSADCASFGVRPLVTLRYSSLKLKETSGIFATWDVG